MCIVLCHLRGIEHKPISSLSVVMLSSPTVGKIKYRVDLIFMQRGIEKEVVDSAVVFKEDNKSSLRVASIGHLIALKTLSMNDKTRPQDRPDLRNLLIVADHKDLAVADKSLQLITERGFHQGKDLKAIFKK